MSIQSNVKDREAIYTNIFSILGEIPRDIDVLIHNALRGIKARESLDTRLEYLMQNLRINKEHSLPKPFGQREAAVDAILCARKFSKSNQMKQLAIKCKNEPDFFWYIFTRNALHEQLCPLEAILKVETRLKQTGFERHVSAFRYRFSGFLDALQLYTDRDYLTSADFLRDRFKTLWSVEKLPSLYREHPLHVVFELYLLYQAFFEKGDFFDWFEQQLKTKEGDLFKLLVKSSKITTDFATAFALIEDKLEFSGCLLEDSIWYKSYKSKGLV